MERTVFQIMLRRFVKALAANYKTAALFAGVYVFEPVFIFLSHIAPDSSLYSVGRKFQGNPPFGILVHIR